MVKGDTAVLVRAIGRVQGVSFRAFVAEAADANGVSGWVRNEADGSVRAHLSGPAPAVERVIEAMRKGPPSADVDRVEQEESAETASGGFRITT